MSSRPASPLRAVSRVALHSRELPRNHFAGDVREGLTAPRKVLLPQYFYDELGSVLFDAICRVPEYYVTRAESEVLATHAAEIAARFGSPVRLIELGAGTAQKTRLLLDALTRARAEVQYVPVDIDASMLERCAQDLVSEYPRLHVEALCSDFRVPSQALEGVLSRERRNVVLFLGSTIGNFTPADAVTMLSDLRSVLGDDDALFLGADLRKPKSILEAAYDDALGVTAAFNLNLLQRINRELAGEFRLDRFRHEAFFNDEESRIEMHLVSTCAQTVRIKALDLDVAFDEGESIHTENSYKYDDAMLAAIAEPAGFRIAKTWTDQKRWFADLLLDPR